MTTQLLLIADDDRELVRALETRCRTLPIEVLTAFDAQTAMDLVYGHRPTAICLDVNMPCGGGLSVCEMLVDDQRLAAIPMIVMTGQGEPETIRRCHSLCAYYIEKGSDVWCRLEPLLRDIFSIPVISGASIQTALTPVRQTAPAQSTHVEPREIIDIVFNMLAADLDFLDRNPNQFESSPPWILCIDDDVEYSNVLRKRLEQYGVAVLRAFEGMEGFRFASTRPADMILLDFELPNGQGDYILDRLKRNPLTADIPVIMITGRRDNALKQRMLHLGAANFFTKPPDMEALVKEMRRHIDILPKPSPPPCESIDNGNHMDPSVERAQHPPGTKAWLL